jgi:beta-glucosidase
VAQMKAGNELLMPGTELQRQTLLAALESGELSEEVLDRNVEWILEVLQRAPAFKGETPSNDPDLEAHARVARDAAAQGMVLLENARALPLTAGAKVALLGNASYHMITGGTGSGDVNEAYSISLLEGLKEQGLAVDEAVAVAYARYLEKQEANQKPPMPFMLPPPIPERVVPADEVARLSRETDVAVVTLGRRSGEFKDRELEGDFLLTEAEKGLLEAVATAFRAEGKKVVVVLNIGGVIETASWRKDADALLVAWQPGQEAGHAIADVLTGRTAPSGKLATTFPLKWEDVPSSANFPGQTLLGPDPESGRGFMRGDRAAEVVYEDGIWVGYRHFATKDVEVAYPFGYGLSYTTFEYGDVALSEGNGTIAVSVPVKNTGSVAGREVVQLYVSAPGTSMPKPAIELRGFAKTRLLKPGESEILSFSLGGRDLASFDEGSSSWIVEAGTHTVKIGASSADIRATATFTRGREEAVESVSGPVGQATD